MAAVPALELDDRPPTLDEILSYDGPEDPDFPGCVPVRMTLASFEEYDGRLEYWDRDVETAWILRDGGPDHENPVGVLPRLMERISLERGSQIHCGSSPYLMVRDARGVPRKAMQPDQAVFLRPNVWAPSGKGIILGEDPLPDVVLEIDHTTDVRRRKLDLYRRWRLPEVWVETPNAPSASRPRSVVPGVTIYRLADGRYRTETASPALPTWSAAAIHSALNEVELSTATIDELVRVGRVLGDREGTGPHDDAQIAGYMRRSFDVGRRQGQAQGRNAGLREGLKEGREQGLKLAAMLVLEHRGVPLAADFRDRLARVPARAEDVLAAAHSAADEADFWRIADAH